MYDRYYSTCQGAAYERGWSEDGKDEGLCFIKKNILLLITTPFFSKSLRKETPFHFSPGREFIHGGFVCMFFPKPMALQARLF